MTYRRNWTRWYPLIWLVFLGLPISALLQTQRSPLEYVYGFSLIAAFVGFFLWSFFWNHNDEHKLEAAYRIPSLIGMVFSYVVFGLMWKLLNGDGSAFVVYAGSFAGFQKSNRPLIVSVVISFALAVAFAFFDANWFVWTIPISTVIAALGNHSAYLQIQTFRRLQNSQAQVASIAKVAERERIARDLHDLLGHTLSVIVLKSELASKLAEKNPAKAIAEIRDVERISREALSEVRSAVRGYRSSGLEAELASISLALEAAQIKLVPFVMPLELEWATEQTLAFILREAITNVVRHSNARTCFVSLEQCGQFVLLEVYDDAQLELKPGNGIAGMRERVAALAGKFSLVTVIGKRGISVKLALHSSTDSSLNPAQLEVLP